jgi:hypothetical protein
MKYTCAELTATPRISFWGTLWNLNSIKLHVITQFNHSFFKVLSQHSPGGNGKNHKKTLIKITNGPVTEPRPTEYEAGVLSTQLKCLINFPSSSQKMIIFAINILTCTTQLCNKINNMQCNGIELKCQNKFTFIWLCCDPLLWSCSSLSSSRYSSNTGSHEMDSTHTHRFVKHSESLIYHYWYVTIFKKCVCVCVCNGQQAF